MESRWGERKKETRQKYALLHSLVFVVSVITVPILTIREEGRKRKHKGLISFAIDMQLRIKFERQKRDEGQTNENERTKAKRNGSELKRRHSRRIRA